MKTHPLDGYKFHIEGWDYVFYYDADINYLGVESVQTGHSIDPSEPDIQSLINKLLFEKGLEEL